MHQRGRAPLPPADAHEKLAERLIAVTRAERLIAVTRAERLIAVTRAERLIAVTRAERFVAVTPAEPTHLRRERTFLASIT
jgi:hypothetical protein